MDENVKKSIIKKAIHRKINTADYESLDINVEIEEEIEWKTIEERMKKTEKISQILLQDWTSTYNEVVKKIGVNKLIGTVKCKENKSPKTTETQNEGTDSFDFL